MLDDSLKLVQRLIKFRFVRLSRTHLGIERSQFRIIRERKRRNPVKKRSILLLFVTCGLHKCRDIAGKALAEIVDQAHFNDLVHIRIRELVPKKESRQRQPPAVVGHALVTVPGRPAVAGGVLQTVGGVQDGQQLFRLHGGASLRFSTV